VKDELLHTLWLINSIYRLVFRERERERERGGVGGEVGLGREVRQLVSYIYNISKWERRTMEIT
jgi:hypothetical protein